MENNLLQLNRLPLNTKGIIHSIECDIYVKKRLLDMGLIKNTCIEPVLNSPTKGIRAYFVRRGVIGIRTEIANLIFISIDKI